jgi:Tol biopolymer transport system component
MWTIPAAGEATPRMLWRDVCEGSISPDGRSLAFVRDARRSSYKLAVVWIASLNGGAERMLRAQRESEWLLSPVWSPDGRWIAYAHLWMNAGKFDGAIEVQPVAGGPAKRVMSGATLPKGTLLCDESAAGLCLGWSPDWRIVFSARTIYGLPSPDGDHSLWAASTQPSTAEAIGNPIKLAHWSDFAPSNPTFTTDGKRLFFLASKTWSDVYVAKLAADKTKIEPPRRFTLDNRGSSPSGWTFDSQAILFSSDRTARREIFQTGLERGRCHAVFRIVREGFRRSDHDSRPVLGAVSGIRASVAKRARRSGPADAPTYRRWLARESARTAERHVALELCLWSETRVFLRDVGARGN